MTGSGDGCHDDDDGGGGGGGGGGAASICDLVFLCLYPLVCYCLDLIVELPQSLIKVFGSKVFVVRRVEAENILGAVEQLNLNTSLPPQLICLLVLFY